MTVTPSPIKFSTKSSLVSIRSLCEYSIMNFRIYSFPSSSGFLLAETAVLNKLAKFPRFLGNLKDKKDSSSFRDKLAARK